MSHQLDILRVGPGVSVQDLGRPGYMGFGLSRGGAADRLALLEGAALLGQSPALAALEMAGFGGDFTLTQDTRFALTGAPMQARLDGQPLVWNAVYLAKAGQKLSIGAARRGVYGYLHLGGGIDTPPVLGSRSRHIAAGLGAALEAGGSLPIGPDPSNITGLCLPVAERFTGGVVRVLSSAQTMRFSAKARRRFEATSFKRDRRGNRQGVALGFDGVGFTAKGQLDILSEIMVPGDIQMTGNGMPFVLLPECQTTGGYPRIGTVVPQDLPVVAQAAPGVALAFRFVSLEEALESAAPEAQVLDELGRQRRALIRNPRDIPDLLSYQLISGAITGAEEP